jgi:hypothetical protein
VRGRGAQHGGDASEPVEQHYVQIRSASSPTEPAVLHGPDSYAQLYLNPPSSHAGTAAEPAAVEVAATVDASVRDVFGVFKILHI